MAESLPGSLASSLANSELLSPPTNQAAAAAAAAAGSAAPPAAAAPPAQGNAAAGAPTDGPSASTSSKARLPSSLDARIGEFCTMLRRGQVPESAAICARKTAELLRSVVSTCKSHDPDAVAALVERVGERIADARPSQLAIYNAMRRIVKSIRDESARVVAGLDVDNDGVGGDGLEPTRASSRRGGTAGVPLLDLAAPKAKAAVLKDDEASRANANRWKRDVAETIGEFLDDLDECRNRIAEAAPELIRDHESILVVPGGGQLATATGFFAEAAKRKTNRFDVAVLEGAPECRGHAMASMLADGNVPTTLAPDTAAFALAGRVDKVVLVADAVLADGSVLTTAGGRAVALAARRHGVPVVVLAGVHKITPLYAQDARVVRALDDERSPAQEMGLEWLGVSEPGGAALSVCAARHDVIEVSLVDLLVTDQGTHAPWSLHRMSSELYGVEIE